MKNHIRVKKLRLINFLLSKNYPTLPSRLMANNF